jgi:hypothetical protein
MLATAQSASAREVLACRYEKLVAAEVARLAGRVPAMRQAQLDEVRAALGRVLDDLVLTRAQAIDDDQLAVLFDLADAP